MNSILNYILPILYFVTAGAYGRVFFYDSPTAKKIKTPLLLVTLIIHFIFLLNRTIIFSHPPVTTIFEIFSVLSFSVALTYIFIEVRSHRKETGYFILNISFIFQLTSSLFIKDTLEVPEMLRSTLFGVHVSSALLGYAALTIAGAYGLMYLMLHHEMKATRFGVVYKKLPTLESLERMTFTAVKLTFLLLTLAIIFGFIWLNQVFDQPHYFDPKLIGTVLVWAMYAFIITAKIKYGWRGRNIMVLSIIGFLFSIFSMTIINIFFSGFHKFY